MLILGLSFNFLVPLFLSGIKLISELNRFIKKREKKKKNPSVILIPSDHSTNTIANHNPRKQIRSTRNQCRRQPPSPAAFSITPATSSFVIQRHHDDDPAFRPPSAYYQTISVDPRARSLSLLHRRKSSPCAPPTPDQASP